MAKVVSSKFGERQLVQLPPVNFSGTKSAAVPTLAPRQYQDERIGQGDYTDRTTSSVHPPQYAYNPGIAPTKDAGNSWMGPPRRPFTDGNIVKETYRPDIEQFNMVQANYGPNGPYLQYTPQALGQLQPPPAQTNQASSAMQPEKGGQEIVPYQGQPTSSATQADVTPSQPADNCAQGQCANPREKHIYYGPNGERLPGPPPGFPTPSTRPTTEVYNQRDFVVDAVLEFGRVKTVTNLDYSVQFPKLPDYLLRHLQRKYGQFERTDARIACRKGEFHVHGVPQIQMQRYPEAGLPPPFDHLAEPRYYGTPPHMERSYPFERDRGYSRYDVTRTAIEDPIDDLRWHPTGQRATTVAPRTREF